MIAKDNGFDFALKLLKKRDYSEGELRLKLLTVVNNEAINDILAKLRHFGYVNDHKVCQRIVEQWWSQGKWGKLLIAEKLKVKGFSLAIIDNILSDFTLEQEFDCANTLFKSNRAKLNTPAKASRFLNNRGFSLEIIEQILQSSFDLEE